MLKWIKFWVIILNVVNFFAIYGDDEHLQINNSDKKNVMAIVSCSGKCGSTTLEHSFKHLNIETYRYHVIEPLYSFIIDKSAYTNILFVDSIRDCISRKISSYFTNLSTHIQLSNQDILKQYEENPAAFVDFLLSNFEKNLLFSIEEYQTSAEWKLFGYDYLKDENFDFNKKYQLKNIDNFYFLNLRFDDIQDWDKIIKSVDLPIDLSYFTIIKTNQTENLWCAAIYKHFLREFTISKSDFIKVCQNHANEMEHFYTTEEINEFIEKWKPFIRD